MKLKNTLPSKKNILKSLVTLSFAFLLSACGGDAAKAQPEAFDGKNYIMESSLVTDESVAESGQKNQWDFLSVPTQITGIGDDFFIVDCYHDQILYHDNLEDPISDWEVLTSDLNKGHTIAGDGMVYLAEDTENNRVLVFEKTEDGFHETQAFDNIGNKPHYTVYDWSTDTFYVWSSFSGEMYLFRHGKDDSRVYLTEIREIEELKHRYVRSFTIVGDSVYFVSGLPTDAEATEGPAILQCDLDDFQIKARYPVADDIAGMAGLAKIGDYFYITVSTDLYGSQDAATILRCKDLKNLEAGDYEDIYADYFVGGGTPYYIGNIGNNWYLTEHRLEDHGVWEFSVDENGEIDQVKALY